MPNVVPNVSTRQIIPQRQSPLETTQSHVVLTCIEAAQTDIVPQFCRINSALQKALVKAKRHLWLIRVKVVACHLGYRLDTVVLVGENLFVEKERLFRVVKHVVYAGDSCHHARLKFEVLLCVSENLDSF